MNNNSAINLIARTAYFNNDYDGSVEREILIRDIPREQQKKEITEYCQNHDDIFAPDIEEELKLDFSDICEILEELEDEGIITKEGEIMGIYTKKGDRLRGTKSNAMPEK